MKARNLVSICLVIVGVMLCIFYSTNRAEAEMTLNWESLSDIPITFIGPNIVGVNGKLHVLSANYIPSHNSSLHYIYDPALEGSGTNPWIEQPVPPTNHRYGMATAVYNGKIYCIGGVTHGGPLPYVSILDTQTGTWSSGTDIPIGLKSGTATVIGDIIYVTGDSDAYFGDVTPGYRLYSYEPLLEGSGTNPWTRLDDIPTPRDSMAATAYNGKLYTFGGYKNPGPVIFDVVEVYNPANGAWETSTDLQMPRERCSFLAVTINNLIYLIAGTGNSGQISIVDIYNPVNNSWAIGTSLPETRTSIGDSSDAVINGQFYITGGEGNGPNGFVYSTLRMTPLIPNHPPVLDPIGNKTVQEGQLLEFQISATDPDQNDVLTFSADNLPPGAIFDPATAIFSWTPTYDQSDVYENIEFIVSDDNADPGVDNELITITVGNVNRPPEFAPVDAKTVNENETLEFTVTASDPDGDTIELSTGELPTGASFDPATGVFSWTPDNTQAGNYVVGFYALDNGVPPMEGELEVAISVGDVPTPIEAINQLIKDVRDMNINKCLKIKYIVKLKLSKRFINRGRVWLACFSLNHFIDMVEFDINHNSIGQEDGQHLIDGANYVLNQLQ